MQLIDILTPVFGVLTTAITSIFTYRMGLRKSNAEARKMELQNVEDAISIWRDTAEAMAKKAEEITKRTNEDYQRLYDQNLELLKKNRELILKVSRLEKELERIKKTV